MTEAEKKRINDIREEVETRIDKKYQYVFDVHGKKCFRVSDKSYILISALLWTNALVVEYAFSEEEAKNNMFEDGDLFHLDDYENENEIAVALEAEIQAAG